MHRFFIFHPKRKWDALLNSNQWTTIFMMQLIVDWSSWLDRAAFASRHHMCHDTSMNDWQTVWCRLYDSNAVAYLQKDRHHVHTIRTKPVQATVYGSISGWCCCWLTVIYRYQRLDIQQHMQQQCTRCCVDEELGAHFWLQVRSGVDSEVVACVLQTLYQT